MAQHFISVDREQVFLMPPSVADWVPEDHLVWSILEAVEQLDLSPFYAADTEVTAWLEEGPGRLCVPDPTGTPVVAMADHDRLRALRRLLDDGAIDPRLRVAGCRVLFYAHPSRGSSGSPPRTSSSAPGGADLARSRSGRAAASAERRTRGHT